MVIEDKYIMTNKLQDLENKKRYYYNGNIKVNAYYLNNKLHNDNGPAYVEYYLNGNKSYESFVINNKNHNINGPAQILYDEDGNIISKFYWINGILISKIKSDKELKQYIKLQNIL